MNINNPFTLATWGDSYNLEGVLWTATLTLNTVVADQDGNLYTAGHYQHHLQETPHFPLLPSPAFVNAQPDPRAVAIAALERAGFRRQQQGLLLIALDSNKPPQSFVLVYRVGDPVHVELEMYTCDRALARYATDCFDVLHEWASQVKWEARGEHD